MLSTAKQDDRDGNQYWLKKTDEIGADINYRAGYNDEQNNKESCERSPHRSFLPGRWIRAHATEVIARRCLKATSCERE